MMKIQFSHLWRKIKNKIPFFHTPRTRFNVGHCSLSVDQFEHTLIQIGYQYNYFSYTEKGQVSNMRRLYMENGVIRQIHIRLFNDGEVMMHDELAYEHDAMAHVDAVSLKYPDANEVATVMTVIKDNQTRQKT